MVVSRTFNQSDSSVVNLFQKILFYLWFLCTLGIALMIYGGDNAEQRASALHIGLQIEAVVTLVLAVPYFLFRSRTSK